MLLVTKYSERIVRILISNTKISVRYAETDKMGIAHHSNYAIWYEAARTDLIKKIGITYSEMENIGVAVPLVELQCKYISAAYYEDELTIEAELTKISPVRLEFEYKVYKDDFHKPISTGKTVHAMVNKEMRPVNVKKNFPDLYRMLESALED